ncbi:MAG: hypothetical protein ACKE5Q_08325 [Methylophilaceae bacterium]
MPPRFKQTTLAIAEDGIALREGSSSVRVLSTSSQELDNQSMVGVLHEHHTLLKGRSVNLVVANTFVRFIVLPWQSGVFSRNDWAALANHAFREQYGPVADYWKIKVNLRGFGESVVATAIDQDLYEGLLSSAKQLGFAWQSIEPVAMRLLNQAKRDYLATLIVEPQHLMLCETSQTQFKRFSVMSPPSGQEAAFASQMLARWQLQLPTTLQLNPSAIYVSGKLKESWPQENQNMHDKFNLTVVVAKQKHQTHASWLTTI